MVGRITASLAATAACAFVAATARPATADAKPAHKAAAAKHGVKAKAPAQKPPAVDVPQSVSQMADWVVRSWDNESMPFAVLDKNAAVIAVYDGDGKMLGAAPALLGSAPGDDSLPGVGDLELADIPMDQRTTPAGRFIGAFGPSASGRDVLWVDYDTAISLHAVINSNPDERRPERLATATPDDNRISDGCINVPTKFYKDVVQPAFSGTKGVFYVLPDTRPVREVFPDYYAQRLASAEPQDQVRPAHRSRWFPFPLW
jgi:hypothetical protein